jgi:hypothetical protein
MPLRSSPRTFSNNAEITAAQEIDLSNRADQRYLRSTAGHSKSNGRELWRYFKEIGEVHYAISRSARIAGYANLRCVELGDNGEIVQEIESGLEADIVNQISSPYGGQRGLIDRFYTLMKVPGDSYLIRLTDGDGDLEGYHFLSPDELDVSNFASWRPARNRDGLRWITLPQTQGGTDQERFVRELRNEDMLGRVWMPDRQYIDLPDSAMNALRVECESLHLLTQTIKSKLMSRFASSGILFIPNTVSTARVRRGQERVGGQEIDDVMNFLITAMTRNMKSWDDAVSRLPIMLKGPEDAGDKIKHIVMDQQVFETDLQLRKELINRIFQGLDSNQDATKGTAEQSHWGMWAASDEERRIAVRPDLEMMSWAMTRLILHRELADAGMPPEQILKRAVWFDLSDASIRANQQEDARQLIDRGLISGHAARRLSGIREEDAIDEEEYVRWVGRQTRNPILMMHGLDEYNRIDWEKAKEFPGGRGPVSGSPAQPSTAGPGEGDPGSPDDRETDTPRRNRPA